MLESVPQIVLRRWYNKMIRRKSIIRFRNYKSNKFNFIDITPDRNTGQAVAADRVHPLNKAELVPTLILFDFNRHGQPTPSA